MAIEFVISLVDKMSGPADAVGAAARRMAGAMEENGNAAKALQAKLNSLEKAGAIAASLGDTAKLQKISEQYAKVSEAAAKLPPPMEKAAEASKDAGEKIAKIQDPTEILKGAFDEATAGVKQFANALKSGDLAGMIEGLGEAIGGAATALDMLVPGLGQAAKVAIQAATGLAGLAFEGAKFAIEATEAEQKTKRLFVALAGAEQGSAAKDMLEEMSAQLGIVEDQLEPLMTRFLTLGVTAPEALHKVTLAAASAGALAKDGAESFSQLFTKIQTAADTGEALKIPLKGMGSLASMGLNVDDVAQRMGISQKELASQLAKGTINASKFGDALQEAVIAKGAKPLEELSFSLGSISSMFKQNLSKLFEFGPGQEGLEKFSRGLKDLAGIFDQNTASGQALHAAVTGVFNGILTAASRALPYIRRGFLDLIIYGLRLYIAAKPLIRLMEQFGRSAVGFALLKSVFIAMTAPVAMLAAMVAYVIFTLSSLASIIQTVINVATSLGSTLLGVVSSGLQTVRDAITSVFSGGAEIAGNFVQGLIDGITGGVDRVVNAAKNLASSATNAVKGVLGIASPSKVMAEFGGHTATGFAEGLDAGSSVVDSSMRAMVAPPADAPMATASASSGKGGGATMNVGGISITITGGDGAKEIQAGLVQKLADTFEQLALQMGAAS